MMERERPLRTNSASDGRVRENMERLAKPARFAAVAAKHTPDRHAPCQN